MSWTIRLAKEAAKQLKGVPADKQKLLRRHLHEIKKIPFKGTLNRSREKNSTAGTASTLVGTGSFLLLIL